MQGFQLLNRDEGHVFGQDSVAVNENGTLRRSSTRGPFIGIIVPPQPQCGQGCQGGALSDTQNAAKGRPTLPHVLYQQEGSIQAQVGMFIGRLPPAPECVIVVRVTIVVEWNAVLHGIRNISSITVIVSAHHQGSVDVDEFNVVMIQ